MLEPEPPSGSSTWERIAVLVVGIILTCVILWFAVLTPEPSDFQYTIFRIALAISGAALAALIPGFIELRYRNVVRAGGALAVLVLVFFFPVAPPTSASPDERPNVDISGDCNVIGSTQNIECNNSD